MRLEANCNYMSDILFLPTAKYGFKYLLIVLDIATRYHDNIQAEKLISDDVSIIEKEKLAHELVNNLNSMVPIFMNIAIIENKLEKYNK